MLMAMLKCTKQHQCHATLRHIHCGHNERLTEQHLHDGHAAMLATTQMPAGILHSMLAAGSNTLQEATYLLVGTCLR